MGAPRGHHTQQRGAQPPATQCSGLLTQCAEKCAVSWLSARQIASVALAAADSQGCPGIHYFAGTAAVATLSQHDASWTSAVPCTRQPLHIYAHLAALAECLVGAAAHPGLSVGHPGGVCHGRAAAAQLQHSRCAPSHHVWLRHHPGRHGALPPVSCSADHPDLHSRFADCINMMARSCHCAAARTSLDTIMLWHGGGAQHCVQSNAEQPTTTRLQLRVVASSCPAQSRPPPGAYTVDGHSPWTASVWCQQSLTSHAD